MLGVVLTALIAAIGASWLIVAQVERSLPGFDAMKTSPRGRTIRIHASDGALIQTLGPAYGDWLPANRIPDVMKKAVVSIEDRRFYEHHGVDPKALVRVAWFAWRHKGDQRRLQGASTITQQAARTVFLTRRYDVSRKLREMAIAFAMERKFDKDRILELYLNKVYLGGGAYGIDAASRRFFGHPATSLTLSEASLLAGLAKAPSDYSPADDQSAAFARQKTVLAAMVETGAASVTSANAARTTHPAFATAQATRDDGTAYFTDYVRSGINVLAPDDAPGSIDVWTTLDTHLQALATAAVKDQVDKEEQGALVTLDADGAIRALVGGKDHDQSPFNRATQALRQPGSSFKLFVYLAALESGMKPGSSVVDAPITIGDWTPKNSERGYIGATTLANAFAQSINTVAARLGRSVGTSAIANMARRFGFTTPISTDPAMVLGSSEAHLLDMTRAYASIASGGVGVAPYGIARITSGNRVIYRHDYEPRLLVTPQTAHDMTAMLQNNVLHGTGAAAAIGRPVAGKTGTTSANRDGWFMGFSSGLTTGVWIGRDDNGVITGLQGGRAPARVFAAYMKDAVEGRPADEFVPLPMGGDTGSVPKPVAAAPSAAAKVQQDDDNGDDTVTRGDTAQIITSAVLRDRGRSRAVPMGQPADPQDQ